MLNPVRLLSALVTLSIYAAPGHAAQPASPAQSEAPLPRVAPADFAKIRLSDFQDSELDLPYYLAHFHVLANAVEDTGADRGHIAVSVWRGNSNTYNARIMENILSLAWFYCADRPWNPYRGDAAVRARLEAALTYWSKIQNDDGQFSEYGPEKWNLAATAFATKFVGEALVLLHQKSAPALDFGVLARADASLRRAIHVTLTSPELWTHGRTFSNQFGNVWSGALAYFSFKPDAGLRALWEKRFHESRDAFQSPAGYYYESDGADFGYTMSTHDHNVRHAWPWLRDTPLAKEVIAKETPWFEWLAYNSAPEPDGTGFVLNRGIETRQRHPEFRNYNTPVGEFIPVVRGFAESREERDARWKRQRAALEKNWPRVAPLKIGEFWAYSPYVFLHRRETNEWIPTTAERDAARRGLPMLARQEFVHQFADSRKQVVYTFVRRPSYYAAFAVGEKISGQQRYGLGLVWTPTLGSVLQTQTASDVAAWGTRAAGAPKVYEDGSLDASPTAPGVRDLPPGSFESRYALGNRGQKLLVFGPDNIVVSISHTGAFTEVIPLLVPEGGIVEIAADRATLRTPAGNFVVTFDSAIKAAVNDAPGTVLAKRIAVLTLSAQDQLTYHLGAVRD